MPAWPWWLWTLYGVGALYFLLFVVYFLRFRSLERRASAGKADQRAALERAMRGFPAAFYAKMLGYTRSDK